MFKSISILLLFVSPLFGEWREFVPPGSIVGQGILRDVVSHCDENGKRTAYEPDYVTYCHEATHLVNSRIRQSIGGTHNNAFYVGDNRVCILTEPNIRLSAVAQYVHPSMRNSTYQLYFVDQLKYWDDCPLYVLDEWVSYIAGLQASKELQVDEHGSRDNAARFAYYADCLVAAVKNGDPNYSQLNDLIAFIDSQKKRLDVMNATAAQQCFGGSCGNGSCQQPSRVIVKPVIKPFGSESVPLILHPPQPLNPPLVDPPKQPTVDYQAEIDKQQKQITELQDELAKVRKLAMDCKPCQCGDHSIEIDTKISAAIANIKFPSQEKPQPVDVKQIVSEVQSSLPPVYIRVDPRSEYQPVRPGQYVTLPLDKVKVQ